MVLLHLYPVINNLILLHCFRILKYSESSYVAQPYIAELEKRDQRGDRVLVRGTQTGSARVVARPQDLAYKVTLLFCLIIHNFSNFFITWLIIVTATSKWASCLILVRIICTQIKLSAWTCWYISSHYFSATFWRMVSFVSFLCTFCIAYVYMFH